MIIHSAFGMLSCSTQDSTGPIQSIQNYRNEVLLYSIIFADSHDADLFADFGKACTVPKGVFSQHYPLWRVKGVFMLESIFQVIWSNKSSPSVITIQSQLLNHVENSIEQYEK